MAPWQSVRSPGIIKPKTNTHTKEGTLERVYASRPALRQGDNEFEVSESLQMRAHLT